MTSENFSELAAQLNAALVTRALGATVRIDADGVEARLENIRADQRESGAALHSTVIAALFDLACGACTVTVDSDHQSSTVQLSIQLMRAVVGDKVRVKARVERAVDGLIYARAELSDARGEICASGSGVFRLSDRLRARPSSTATATPARRIAAAPAPLSAADFDLLELATHAAPPEPAPISSAAVRVLLPTTFEVAELAWKSPEKLEAKIGARLISGWDDLKTMLEMSTELLRDEPGEAGWWSNFILQGEEVVGFAGFKGPPLDGAVEIACVVAPACQGLGIGTAAAKQLLEHAFATPGVSVVEAKTAPENDASTHILEKLGFSKLGEIEDPNHGQLWSWEKKR